jgi:hypothetical protein
LRQIKRAATGAGQGDHMTSFTPLAALVGGALIGLAALLLWTMNGRIAGLSGVVGGLLEPAGRDETAGRVAFVAGLVTAPLGYAAVSGALPSIAVTASPAALVAAGLLVGFGSRLGGGCTSGHGVCGVSRLSPRSLVATAVFVVAGIATVFVVRHLLAG